jgi:TraM recognition site of TraD and TraG
MLVKSRRVRQRRLRPQAGCQIQPLYAAQTWRQLAAVFGEQEAQALFGLTNVLVMFGGLQGRRVQQEISDLVGQTRVSRSNWQTGAMAGRTFSGEDIAIIRPEEIRRLPERHALVIAESGKPIIARLSRCIDERAGARLLAEQQHLRAELAQRPNATQTAEAGASAALAEARRRGITAEGALPVTGSPENLLLVRPFPAPGQLVALAYRELDRAATGSPEQIRALGDARLLPRPWEPATCRTPQLREQLWLSLDAVIGWLVTEYVWEVADTIPACWPQHPHLVHEIAVLADQL